MSATEVGSEGSGFSVDSARMPNLKLIAVVSWRNGGYRFIDALCGVTHRGWDMAVHVLARNPRLLIHDGVSKGHTARKRPRIWTS